MQHSPEYDALKPSAIVVLLLLIRKHNGHNNGEISLGVREVAARCHLSMATASRALKSLQQAGLITETYKGHLVPKVGERDVASRWKLNFAEDAPKSSRRPYSGAAANGSRHP